ncbi:MAG: DNA polymerase IV [Maricaulaceae bacterium]|jgi:DNA polymerase-4
MIASGPSAGWCRDCLAPVPALAPPRCSDCGSRRFAVHPEIATLSIAHIDCDAFYAAVEKRDDPSLAERPLIIGGGRRGVVSTACYIARAFGVHSAMPMFKALELCPDATVLKPQMAKYVAESKRVRALMDEITPIVEPLSIDEAFLDLSGTERVHHAPPALTLIRLQTRIEEEVGITVSVGLAPNKFLAKIASDLDKPRGFSVIGAAEAEDFLADKPVSIIYGVGPAMANALAKDGYHKIKDLRRASERELANRYGETGLRLYRLARGEDARAVNTTRGRKSISSETTFNQDLHRLEDLEAALWRLCVRMTDSAKAKGWAGRTVTLKLKTSDHRIRTRRRTLEQPTQLAETAFRVTQELLRPEADGQPYRLIGAGLSDLEPAGPDAADLLDPGAARRAAAERAADKARARFGDDAVQKGRGLRPKS